MDEDKLADLNDIQDFFNRSHSTSASGTFCTEQIDIKDFIEWCNDPCNNISESANADSAYRLGQTVCVLDKLDGNVIDRIYDILEDTASSMIGDTDLNSLSYREKTKKINGLLEEAHTRLGNEKELYPELKNRRGNIPQDLSVNAAFYCALKLRLEDFPDEQGYYRYQFDGSGSTIAQVSPLKPFVVDENDRLVLSQQWHVLISLLAFLDVAHALSNDQHKYHCLYPYLSSYDKGDLNKMRLKLKSNLSLEVTPEIDKVTNYTSEPMMTWIKDALVKPEDK